jgi:hypothetical protein
MQPQPEHSDSRRDQFTSHFGLLSGRAENNEVIRIPRQNPQSLSLAPPRLIQHVQRDVRQQRGDRRPLRGPGLDGRDDPALKHPSTKPASQQLHDPPVGHPPLNLSDQRLVRDLIEARLDVGIEHPRPAPVDRPSDGLQSMMRRTLRAKPVAARKEVSLEDRLEHDLRCRHHYPVGDRWDPERPQLTWPPGFRDLHPPKRPRPISPGPQLHGERVEEIADPGTLDLLDGHTINTGRPAVSTNLTPGSPHDVAAGDMVKESMETTILILLGTAVQHTLKGTNPVPTRQGAADGPSRHIGTHQRLLPALRASMKCGPFPHRRLCCPTAQAVLRPAPTPARPRNPFPGFAGYRRASLPAPPQGPGPRRVSPVPRTAFRPFHAQYAGGSFSVRSWIPDAFHGLRRAQTGSAPSLPSRRTRL